MLVCIVRHGIAIDPSEPNCPPEPRRYLTEEGIDKTRKAVQGLHALGVEPEVIFTSPYLRAVQTAELLAEEFGMPRSTLHETKSLRPGADPSDIFKEIQRAKADCVVCTGHAPLLDDIITLALGAPRPATSLKKAGAALLDLSSILPPKGLLEWMLTPKQLRRLRD